MRTATISKIANIKFILILAVLSIVGAGKSYSQCAVLETFTSNPLPVAGNAYPVDSTITFCYSLNGFFQNGSNWVDGFIITLGNGWDASSLTPILTPNSCSAFGYWDFYQSVTSTATGLTFGPGFYFDSYDAFGFFDTVPGNDLGDFTVTGTCQWDLCFSVKVNPTCANSDLSVFVTAAGDGMVGSWVFNDCPGIPFQLSNATCIAYCTGFEVNVSGTNPNCLANNGSITSTVTAGTLPFNYQWSSGALTPAINNLLPGLYVITVTDANFCETTDSINLVLPSSFTLADSIFNASCLSYCNGTISISTIGGASPFTYQWSGGLPTMPDQINLCAGIYYVTVTDANFCTVSSSYIVTEPAGMNISMISNITTCMGGCDGGLTAQVTLGTSPYNLLWFNNSTSTSIAGLCAGSYNISVTDANGCTLLGTGTVNQPQGIIVTTYPRDVSCKGFSDGWITFTHQNATLPINSIWMPGAFPFDTIKNLVPGNYNVTITDINGCTGNSSATVGEPTLLAVTVVTTNTSCPLSADGEAMALPSGGIPQYNYIWVNASGQTTALASNLVVGDYDVLITDANGCTATAGSTVFANDLFYVNAYGDTTIINENSTIIGVNVFQNGNYSYSWIPDEFIEYPNFSTALVSPTVTTTFTITVVEAGSGCTNIDSLVVNVLPTTYIFIPNAFSPNGDGFNDLFELIKGEVVSLQDVQILNRWGQIVYRQPYLNWDGNNLDGKPCSLGVYAFVIVYKIAGDNNLYRREGNVTLLR